MKKFEEHDLNGITYTLVDTPLIKVDGVQQFSFSKKFTPQYTFEDFLKEKEGKHIIFQKNINNEVIQYNSILTSNSDEISWCGFIRCIQFDKKPFSIIESPSYQGGIFTKEKLEFYLPDTFKSLSKDYMIAMVMNENIQNSWIPSIGDIIVTQNGQIHIINDAIYPLNEDEDIMYFIYDTLSFYVSKNNIPYCSIITKNGTTTNPEFKHPRKLEEFRYIPYPHEIFTLCNQMNCTCKNSLLNKAYKCDNLEIHYEKN